MEMITVSPWIPWLKWTSGDRQHHTAHPWWSHEELKASSCWNPKHPTKNQSTWHVCRTLQFTNCPHHLSLTATQPAKLRAYLFFSFCRYRNRFSGWIAHPGPQSLNSSLIAHPGTLFKTSYCAVSQRAYTQDSVLILGPLRGRGAFSIKRRPQGRHPELVHSKFLLYISPHPRRLTRIPWLSMGTRTLWCHHQASLGSCLMVIIWL